MKRDFGKYRTEDGMYEYGSNIASFHFAMNPSIVLKMESFQTSTFPSL